MSIPFAISKTFYFTGDGDVGSQYEVLVGTTSLNDFGWTSIICGVDAR
jgi:hypothetical protein